MGVLQSSLVRSVGLQYPTLQNLTGDAAGSLRWLSNTASRSFDGYSPLGAITCVVDSTTLNCAVVLDTGQMARPFSTSLPTLAQGGQQHLLGNLVLSGVGESAAAGDGSSILVDTLCCVTHTQANISTGEAVERRHGLFHRFRAFNTRLCAAPHKCIKNTSSAYKICD